MKKILLFCSLAIFVFCLATSVQAAVTDVVITGGELNYQTIQPITWIYDGTVATPRFNISMVAGSVSLSIATQVLCKAPAGTNVCTSSWKVGSLKSGRFVLGTEYRIKVCVVGSTDTLDCKDSLTVFKIIPPALTTQWQVLNLFKTAMSNRYNDLNSNAKSGAQGVYDYIIGQAKIDITTVNADKVYAKTVLEQLDWFKTNFLTNAGNVLETKDKTGIKYAMSRRYSDLCATEWNKAIKNATGVYNTAVADAGKARKGVKARVATATTPAEAATGEELCNFNYNRDLKDTVIVPARNGDYDNATKRFAAIEGLNNIKNTCINATYTAFYAAKNIALSVFATGKTVADGPYNTCIGNRISAWGSWQ